MWKKLKREREKQREKRQVKQKVWAYFKVVCAQLNCIIRLNWNNMSKHGRWAEHIQIQTHMQNKSRKTATKIIITNSGVKTTSNQQRHHSHMDKGNHQYRLKKCWCFVCVVARAWNGKKKRESAATFLCALIFWIYLKKTKNNLYMLVAGFVFSLSAVATQNNQK